METAVFTHIQKNKRAAFTHSAVANVHGEATGPTSLTIDRAEVFNQLGALGDAECVPKSTQVWMAQLQRAADAILHNT